MPAGAKLKPMRYKFTMHDYREHRKIAFHAKLLEQSWDVIFDSEDVESASRYLQSTLRDLMNENFPAKTVRMSTHVPMDITENIPAPQLTLSQVYYALLKTKQTSTGPDNIPF